MPIKAHEIHLKAYPEGLPGPELFELKTVTLPEPKEGEIALRMLWMSVDPYMRGRMNPAVRSYIPAFKLGEALDGGAVGQVIASRHPDYAEGDLVTGFGGWRDHWVGEPKGYRKIPASPAPLSAWLGVLGMPGMTAWVGFSQILKPRPGETLFVSGAAGAVGSLACQIGKIRGCRVIGSAGSAAKCAWLTGELGADAALDYHDYRDAKELTKALAAHAPEGIDVYFENVGGMHLEAALNVIAFNGRIALCGMISENDDPAPAPGPGNLVNLIGRSVLMQGFIVRNYTHLMPEFLAEVSPWLAQGRIRFQETVYEGLEQAPQAFLGLFRGDNTGKAVVRIAAQTA